MGSLPRVAAQLAVAARLADEPFQARVLGQG
jgi:hypothetical protein